jgi:hypothetical protein
MVSSSISISALSLWLVCSLLPRMGDSLSRSVASSDCLHGVDVCGSIATLTKYSNQFII